MERVHHTFTPLKKTNPKVDAVRYSVTRDVPVFFAHALGKETVTVEAEAIARLHRELQELDVSAKCNPWLAGSSAGTRANSINPHQNPDVAGVVGKSGSPIDFTLPVFGGKALSFDSMDGGAAWGTSSSNSTLNPGDGHPTKTTYNRYANGKVPDANNDGKPDQTNPYSPGQGSENGKADLVAPYTSVIGVFLTAAPPSNSKVPPHLDFSTAASRDFGTLRPMIAQPFFIGDGRDADGNIQKFVVPEGATRLYLGVMDGYEWGNNTGGFKTIVKEYGTIALVK